MTPELAAICAFLVISGIFVIVLGFIPEPDARRSRDALGILDRWTRLPQRSKVQLVAGFVGGLAAYGFTGWPIFVVLGPLAVWGLPTLLSDPPNRDIELLEALDRWIQLLLGSIPTGKSIPDAVRATRSQVPSELAEPVARLVARLDVRWPVRDAFLALADELDSPEADAAIASLILSSERGGVGATASLHALSQTIRARLTALREVESERAKPRIVVRQVTGISVAVLGAGLIFGGEFFAPYKTPIGQAILAVLIAIYIGALVTLRRMTVAAHRDRLLRYATTEAPHV